MTELGDLSTAELLDRLGKVSARLRSLDEDRASRVRVVAALRARSVPWSELSTAAGVSQEALIRALNRARLAGTDV